jgi:tripartite-type tricarboxylate transporter receptor subunit TctC
MLIVPFAAGGGVDTSARIQAAKLGELLGQPIVAENVGAAAGMVGSARVAKGEPDGYLFLIGNTGTHAYSQSVNKNPLYNAATDFAPVGLVSESPRILDVRKDLPVSSLQEFVAYAKANHDKIQYGSSGTGAGAHICALLLDQAMGVKVTHVPYRDIGPLTQDMIAGRIDYQCPLPGTMIPLIETNRVKGIATLGKQRLAGLPNLASAHEQGLTDFDGTVWWGFFLPKGTPEPIVRKLNAAAIATIDTPAVQQRLAATAATVVAPERRSPEYLQKFVASEIDKWAAPIRASGALIE